MGRKIQHNNIVTDELLAQCNKENIELGNDFLDYLRSVDRSPNTINAYRRDLYIFWVYLLQHCDNKFFIDLSKRRTKYVANTLLTILPIIPIINSTTIVTSYITLLS